MKGGRREERERGVNERERDTELKASCKGKIRISTDYLEQVTKRMKGC